MKNFKILYFDIFQKIEKKIIVYSVSRFEAMNNFKFKYPDYLILDINEF